MSDFPPIPLALREFALMLERPVEDIQFEYRRMRRHMEIRTGFKFTWAHAWWEVDQPFGLRDKVSDAEAQSDVSGRYCMASQIGQYPGHTPLYVYDNATEAWYGLGDYSTSGNNLIYTKLLSAGVLGIPVKYYMHSYLLDKMRSGGIIEVMQQRDSEAARNSVVYRHMLELHDTWPID